MSITKDIFESYKIRPQAALLMSGAGSNAEAILSSQKLRDLYDFVVVASDNSNSNAAKIASEHETGLYIQHQERLASPEDRAAYFDRFGSNIARFGASIAIYAGFMKISTHAFCESFPGVNVHPADLTIMGEDGLPKYRGMRALGSMRADLGTVRSTVHVVDNPVDSGSAISLSEQINPPVSLTDLEVHTLLKQKEHAVFTLTLELLGLGQLNPALTPYSYEQIAGTHHE